MTAWRAVDSVRRRITGVARRAHGARRNRPVRVDSDVGPLLFQAHDKLMAPMIARSGRWEVEEADALRELLQPGMTFLDVGAHVGYMTMLGARAVGPSGRVIAVEAAPANAALLRANIAANGMTNVEVIEAAASDRDGRVVLSQSPWNSGDNRAYAVPEMTQVEVPAVRLDGVIGPSVRVDVVKVDTQGTDHRAIRGMQALLARSRSVLVVEFWPHGIVEGGDDPMTVLSLYGAMGFDVRFLGQPAEGPAPSPHEMVAEVPLDEGKFRTLVLRPGRPASGGVEPVQTAGE